MALTKSWILQDPVRLGLYDAHPEKPVICFRGNLASQLCCWKLTAPSGWKQDGDGNWIQINRCNRPSLMALISSILKSRQQAALRLNPKLQFSWIKLGSNTSKESLKGKRERTKFKQCKNWQETESQRGRTADDKKQQQQDQSFHKKIGKHPDGSSNKGQRPFCWLSVTQVTEII